MNETYSSSTGVRYINKCFFSYKMQGKELRAYTINDYKRVLSLRKKGYSKNKIAEKGKNTRKKTSLWNKTFKYMVLNHPTPV